MTYRGTYGSGRTPCTVYAHRAHGLTWYAVEGSKNINATRADLFDGVDVETLPDVDCITGGRPVQCVADLVAAVES